MAEEMIVKELDDVVVRFSGDSGDGMQLAGNMFSNISATEGHFLAPSMIETFELFKIKGSNGPFLTIFIVYFKMMEVKGHRQLVALRC